MKVATATETPLAKSQTRVNTSNEKVHPSFTTTIADPAVNTLSSVLTSASSSSKTTRLIVDLVDGVLRSFIRMPEMMMDSQFGRVAYRFVSEMGRKSSEFGLITWLDQKSFRNQEVKESFGISMTRAIENTVGSAVFEPMFFQVPAKIGMGCLNMLARFVTRTGLHLASFGKIVNKRGLSLAALPEEFFSRTLFRAFSTTSSNPFIQLTFRCIEQVLINTNLHQFHFFSKLLDKAGLLRPYINAVHTIGLGKKEVAEGKTEYSEYIAL